MIDYGCRIIDDIIGGFSHNVSLEVLVTTYFFLIFIEFPRYYLMEIIIVARRKLLYWKYSHNKKQHGN